MARPSSGTKRLLFLTITPDYGQTIIKNKNILVPDDNSKREVCMLSRFLLHIFCPLFVLDVFSNKPLPFLTLISSLLLLLKITKKMAKSELAVLRSWLISNPDQLEFFVRLLTRAGVVHTEFDSTKASGDETKIFTFRFSKVLSLFFPSHRNGTNLTALRTHADDFSGIIPSPTGNSPKTLGTPSALDPIDTDESSSAFRINLPSGVNNESTQVIVNRESTSGNVDDEEMLPETDCTPPFISPPQNDKPRSCTNRSDVHGHPTQASTTEYPTLSGNSQYDLPEDTPKNHFCLVLPRNSVPLRPATIHLLLRFDSIQEHAFLTSRKTTGPLYFSSKA